MLKKSSSLLLCSLALFALSSTAYAGYSSVTSTASITFSNYSTYYKVTGKGTGKASGTGEGEYLHVTTSLEKNGDLIDININGTTSSSLSVNATSGREGDPADYYLYSDSLLACDSDLSCYVDSDDDEDTESHPGL